MGFFSWKTADTNRSIGNIHSTKPHIYTGAIYLLQPNGQPPIEEKAYEGYGVFGGVDAYLWVGVFNAPDERLTTFIESIGLKLNIDLSQLKKLLICGQDYNLIGKNNLESIQEFLRTYAIYAFGRNCIFDKETGKQLICEFDGIPSHCDEPIPAYDNKTLNQLLEQGLIIRTNVSPIYPLKFSFNKFAVYENLTASTECHNQGYFY